MARRKTTETKIVLPERLGAAAIATAVQSAMAARGKPLVVDAAQLRSLGGPGVQALLSIAKTWQRDGVAFQLTNVGVEVRSALSVLGIAPTLLHIQESA